MSLRIDGHATLSSAGDQHGALAGRVTATAAGRHPGAPAGELGPEPLPPGDAHAFLGFDIRQRLGRRGTSFYDRVTGLAVVACGDALTDAGLVVDDTNRHRIGVALATTLGSFKSTSDYTRDTLTQDKPYLVNPVLFPNTVMNCAAGQAAIRHRLKGVNATVTGGPLAFFSALRYAANAIRRGYADTMLVGAAEEFSAHRAWATALDPAADGIGAGDGAAVFVLSGGDNDGGDSDGGPAVRAVATGYGPGGAAAAALAGCVRRVLSAAGTSAAEVTMLATTELGHGAGAESGPVAEVLGRRPEELTITRAFGDCGAATPALALATVLELRPGGLTLLTARDADGGVGAALVRA